MAGFAEVVGGCCCRRCLAATVMMKSRQGIFLFQIVVAGSVVPLAGAIWQLVLWDGWTWLLWVGGLPSSTSWAGTLGAGGSRIYELWEQATGFQRVGCAWNKGEEGRWRWWRMGSMITPEVHRKGAGGAALLCHIWHCFQILRLLQQRDGWRHRYGKKFAK